MVATAEASLSEVTGNVDDNAFDLEAVRRLDDDRLHGVIGRMEFHSAGLTVIHKSGRSSHLAFRTPLFCLFRYI